MLLLTLLFACSDYRLSKQQPDLRVSASAVDFGDVVIDTSRTGTLKISNAGGGVLNLDRVGLESAETFTLATLDGDAVDPGASLDLSVTYAPVSVGMDTGSLEIVSDDPDSPLLVLPLTGFGVQPEIDIDPEVLWFGDVAVGDTKTLSVDVNARGRGTLQLDGLDFQADEAEAFSISLPSGLSLPSRLEPGTGFSFDVTFTPTDERAWDGALLLSSNDPVQPIAAVSLLANADGSGVAPPTVEITSPDWGTYLQEGEPVTLSGVVVDDADAPSNLLAIWYANGALLGSSKPDDSGLVTLDTDALPAGDVTLRLAAMDSAGLTGSDEVEVTLWEQDQPSLYLLSGGASPFEYWSVDDDVTITLDGVEIFSDTNHTQDTHPPLTFEASAGQVLRIVAVDYNACDQALDGLILHWGTGQSQDLNEASCRSSCPSHACYDPSFLGPWPSVFLDLSVTIAIP